MNSNDTEAMVKAAEDLLRMEAINSTQWRTLSEKVADFAAEQIATQTAELQKRLADAEAEIQRLKEALEGAFKLLSGPSVINNAFRLGAFGALDIEKAVTLIQQALEQENQQEEKDVTAG